MSKLWFVTTELDTLATALYAVTDDMLKESPHLAPLRPAVGISPQLSDSELVTLAVLQALLGFTSEARWVRHVKARMGHLFPYVPKQPGYNKRLRAARGLIRHCARALAASTSLWSDDVWVVDSTPVECARSRETVRRSDLAGWAQYGYCASHSRWFWGLRLHLDIVRTWTTDLRELEAILPKLTGIPTLLMWGSKDTAVYASSAKPLAKYFPNSQQIVLPGVGHLPYEECPEEFNRALIAFLNRKSG